MACEGGRWRRGPGALPEGRCGDPQQKVKTVLRYGWIFLALGLFFCRGGPADAHVHLKSSSPAANSSLDTAPIELTLVFTEGLESALCTVSVADSAGAAAVAGPAEHDPVDASLIHVALAPLPAGLYRVTWRVVGADGHAMSGVFRFTVAP